MQRDAAREARRRSRRRMILVSVAIHGLLVVGLIVYSIWNIEELWTPSVEVKVFHPSKLPPGVITPAPPTSGEVVPKATGEAPPAASTAPKPTR